MRSFPADSDDISVGFPERIELPQAVDHARARRTRRLTRVAVAGIAVRLLVIAMELTGVWLLGHAVLLVDALASLMDVLASFMIIVAIQLAARPPDEEHPFGHGRYEPLAGLQLGVLLGLLGVFLFAQQLWAAATTSAAGNVHWMAAMIPLVAALVLEGCCQIVLRVGRSQHSAALVAEAFHYRVDAVTSAIAATGLLIAAYLPPLSALVDHLSAMLLAGVMVGLGIMAARENLHQLIDRVPDERWFELVRQCAERVDGVLDVEKVRIQRAGPDAHVDIDIEVDPRQTVSEAHVISQRVRADIQTQWPAVRDVIVHVEPYYEGDH